MVINVKTVTDCVVDWDVRIKELDLRGHTANQMKIVSTLVLTNTNGYPAKKKKNKRSWIKINSNKNLEKKLAQNWTLSTWFNEILRY